MIDIDGFKETNDAFGHEAGDRSLKTVASILSHEVRRADVVVRHGGDEFLLILPHTDIGGAGVLMSRVETALSALSPNISISFGFTTWIPGCEESTSLVEMVGLADEAMFIQKEGKRSTVAADPTP
jgi:diguanylate cyclase (GGDEF)-like protein